MRPSGDAIGCSEIAERDSESDHTDQFKSFKKKSKTKNLLLNRQRANDT